MFAVWLQCRTKHCTFLVEILPFIFVLLRCGEWRLKSRWWRNILSTNSRKSKIGRREIKAKGEMERAKHVISAPPPPFRSFRKRRKRRRWWRRFAVRNSRVTRLPGFEKNGHLSDASFQLGHIREEDTAIEATRESGATRFVLAASDTYLSVSPSVQGDSSGIGGTCRNPTWRIKQGERCLFERVPRELMKQVATWIFAFTGNDRLI